MQKRVALARAIAAQPDIMFFDEPTTGLDPIMGAVIDDLVVNCVRQLGSTAEQSPMISPAPAVLATPRR